MSALSNTTVFSTMAVAIISIVMIVACHLSFGSAAPVKALNNQYLRRNHLKNRTIPCTKEERVCFDKNMVRYPIDGGCYPLWERGPCREGQWLVVNKDEALSRGGHVMGVCEPDGDHLCPPLRVLMAHDERCALRQLVCSGAAIALDVFGKGECVGQGDDGEASLPVALPSGSCKTPSHNIRPTV